MARDNSAQIGVASLKYFLSRFIPAIMGFLTIPIYTKLLGPYLYGTFSLLMGAISFVVVLGTGWLESTYIRFLSKKDAEQKDYAYNYLVLLLVSLSIIAFIGLTLIVLLRFTERSNWLRFINITLLTSLVIGLFRSTLNYFRAEEKPTYYTLTNVAFISLRFLLAWVLLYYYSAIPEVIFFAFIVVGLAVSLFPMMGIMKVARGGHFQWRFVKEMMAYGFPYIPVLMSAWFFTFYNRFIIEIILGREAVGVYAAAFNITDQSIGFLYTAIMMAVFPRLVKIYKKEELEASSNLLEKGLEVFAIIIIPAMAGFAIVGQNLILLLTSSDYSGAISIIPIMAFSTMVIGVNQYLSKPFELARKTKTLMKISLIGGAVNGVLAYPSIKTFGIMGAPFSTLISVSTMAILFFVFGKKIIRIKFPSIIFIKTLSATAIMVVTVVTSQPYFKGMFSSIIFPVLIGIIVYGLLVVLLKLHIVLKEIF